MGLLKKLLVASPSPAFQQQADVVAELLASGAPLHDLADAVRALLSLAPRPPKDTSGLELLLHINDPQMQARMAEVAAAWPDTEAPGKLREAEQDRDAAAAEVRALLAQRQPGENPWPAVKSELRRQVEEMRIRVIAADLKRRGLSR